VNGKLIIGNVSAQTYKLHTYIRGRHHEAVVMGGLQDTAS